MKAAELCAGYGGLALAIEQVFQAELAWVSEFEEAPSKILKYRWPHAPNLGDMTTINWYGVEPVQVLGAGTPCQDLSTAGRRRGMTEGTRSNLWVHMREAIATIKPTYVVWENVRGAYSATASSDLEHCTGCMGDAGDERAVLRALGRVLGDLSDLGYDCQWRGLRAADVGACHGRFRVFVLARRRDVGVPRYSNVADVERRRTTGRGNTDPQQSTRPHRSPGNGHRTPTPADSDGIRHERPGDSRGRWSRLEDSHEPTPDASGDGWLGRADLEGEGRLPGVGGEEVNHSLDSGASRPATNASGDGWGEGWPESEGLEGRPYAPLGSATNWGVYEPAIRRWERILGRAAPRPTEPTGRDGGQRLSPRFTEFMMGLPDGWVTDPAIGISRNEQLKACGNGVVPQQAIAALEDMLAAYQTQAAAA